MKLKELSPAMIKQISELEVRNILPTLMSLGIESSEGKFRTQFLKNLDNDILIYQNNGQVIGFILYKKIKSEISIQSVNMAKSFNGSALKDLLLKAFAVLKKENIETIKSQAHIINKKSINFHRKLGFKETTSKESSLSFVVNRDDLLGQIRKRLYPE